MGVLGPLAGGQRHPDRHGLIYEKVYFSSSGLRLKGLGLITVSFHDCTSAGVHNEPPSVFPLLNTTGPCAHR